MHRLSLLYFVLEIEKGPIHPRFGSLKSRFKVLANKPYFPFRIQVKIVIACCVLHNWILDNGPDAIIYDEEIWYNTLPRSARVARDQDAENREWVARVARDQDAQVI